MRAILVLLVIVRGVQLNDVSLRGECFYIGCETSFLVNFIFRIWRGCFLIFRSENQIRVKTYVMQYLFSRGYAVKLSYFNKITKICAFNIFIFLTDKHIFFLMYL